MLLATSTGLVRMSDEGGATTHVTDIDWKLKENAHAVPMFLPDGNHFLYVITAATQETNGIFVGSLDGKTSKRRLAPFGMSVGGIAYAPPGYLIVAGESLTAQRFNPVTLTLSGPPVPLAERSDGVSVSDTGLLVYRKSSATAADKQLTWFDRMGRPLGQLGRKPTTSTWSCRRAATASPWTSSRIAIAMCG